MNSFSLFICAGVFVYFIGQVPGLRPLPTFRSYRSAILRAGERAHLPDSSRGPDFSQIYNFNAEILSQSIPDLFRDALFDPSNSEKVSSAYIAYLGMLSFETRNSIDSVIEKLNDCLSLTKVMAERDILLTEIHFLLSIREEILKADSENGQL
jgi:hypothetical protein